MAIATVGARTRQGSLTLATVVAALALCPGVGCVLTERELGPNLSCEAGHCQCTAGWADCDGEPANGCELSLVSDPVNCGACGRDCLGGECLEGQCQPAIVYESFLPGSISIALGSRYLFWREERFLGAGERLGVGSLWAMALDGGSPEQLASDIPATALAAGNDTLYWTEAVDGERRLRGASVERAARDIAVVSTNADFEPKCFAADDARIYVGAEDYLLEVDPAADTATPVAAWQSPCDVLVREASFVAWMDPSMAALHLFDVVNRQERAFPTGEVRPTWVSILAASPAAAYWAEGTDPWFVRAMSIDSGELSDFATLASAPSSMVVAEPYLYVGRAGAGVIEAIALTGGEPIVLATGQATLESLRASPEAIYFSSGRRIKRLAR